MTAMKRCSRCKADKPISNFHGDRSQADGRQSRCNECQRSAKRKYRAAHPDRVRAAKRRYYAEHLDQERARDRRRYATQVSRQWPATRKYVNPEKARARSRRYVSAHPERRSRSIRKWIDAHRAQGRASAKRWSEANPEKVREKARRFRQNSPDKARVTARKGSRARYARKHGAFIEHVDPRIVFDRDKGICGICRQLVERSGSWHIDHVIPLSKGGRHAYDNVQLAHASCNCKKRDKIVAAA